MSHIHDQQLEVSVVVGNPFRLGRYATNTGETSLSTGMDY